MLSVCSSETTRDATRKVVIKNPWSYRGHSQKLLSSLSSSRKIEKIYAIWLNFSIFLVEILAEFESPSPKEPQRRGYG